jgi:hypothetical protein
MTASRDEVGAAIDVLNQPRASVPAPARAKGKSIKKGPAARRAKKPAAPKVGAEPTPAAPKTPGEPSAHRPVGKVRPHREQQKGKDGQIPVDCSLNRAALDAYRAKLTAGTTIGGTIREWWEERPAKVPQAQLPRGGACTRTIYLSVSALREVEKFESVDGRRFAFFLHWMLTHSA